MFPSRSRASRLPLLIALGVLAATGAEGSEYRETVDFADAAAVAESYADRYGAENTLAVFDIDNTLLAMQGALGSDQWFEWQEYLLEQEPDSPQLVAEDFGGLLEVQGLLFTLGKMRPPQEDLPELVRGLQQRGVPTLVLTSRGADFRAATQRELTAAGYDFATHCPPMAEAPAGEFLPYDLSNLAAVGISAEDAELFKLGEPRPVLMEKGVYMTAGQHKGAMLLTAIHRMPHPPKAVVFVDDHGRHVNRVYDALTRRGIEATVVHYHREDEPVERFRYSDKRDVVARWRRLESALKEVFSLPGDETPHTAPHSTADAAPAAHASH